MSTRRWRGDAPAVAQVDTLTVGGTVEIGDKFIIAIGNKSLSVSSTTTNVDTTATEIATAWNALSSTEYPEYAEITAAAVGSGGALTLTGDTKGKPFTVSVSTTESNGAAADAQTFTRTATTACSGPNHWDTAANWVGNAVPVNGDDVVIENSSKDILYGLAQSAVTLTSLTIEPTFTGKIGLPFWNAGGYYEYRDTYLAIGATTITRTAGPGTGSGRIKIDTGSVACTLVIHGTGSPAEEGIPAFLWKGTSSSNSLLITKGSLGVALFAGETANLSGDIQMGYQTNVEGDAVVYLGSGVTLDDITKNGGFLEINSNADVITHNAGTIVLAAGTLTTTTIRGGKVIHKAATLTTLTLSGTQANPVDYDATYPATKTITNRVEVYGDYVRFRDPNNSISSLILDLNECGNLANFELGRNISLTRGTVS